MEGNIVGEPFEDFVAKQIDIRQKAQFGGYNFKKSSSGVLSLRTNDEIQYFTNRNAWVKLASSVRIDQGPTTIVQQQVTNTGQTVTAGTTGGLTGGVNVGFGSSGGLGAITNSLSTITNTVTVNLNSKRLQKIFGNSSVTAQNFPGTKLPEAAVLFNTLSSYTSPTTKLNSTRAGISKSNSLWNNSFAYGIGGTEFGIQPPPGIVSVQVDALNRGSIRKANVVLKVHNRFQFDLIELLYLRLGFTMMLEWGWDRYLDDNNTLQEVGNTIIEREWFSSNGISQLEMLSKIQAIREEYRGNVDGFFGKVSNFTWSFNPDGTYDITIDLITLGDVIESIKVNTPSKQKFSLSGTTPFTTPQEAEPTYGNIAEAATLTALGSYLFERVVYMKQQNADALTESTNGIESTNFIRVKPTIVQTGTGTAEDPTTANFNSDRYFYYIKLGYLLQNLQNYIIPQVVNGQSKKPQINISSDELLNIISYFPNQISLDPKVCIFNANGALNSYGDIVSISIPSSLTFAIDPYVETNPTTSLKYGQLMNLYMNIEFISSLLISNGSSQELFLFKFLQDLCNGINDALGGVNKLEPVIKNDSTVVFIDQTLSIPVNDTVNLEVYGYNTKAQTSNFVKDIKFESKITPQLASTISIGATAAGTSTSEIDGTAFEKWNEELTDRFAQSIEAPTFPETVSSTTTNTADKTTYETKFNKYLRAGRSPWVDFLYIIGVTDRNAVKRYVNDPSYPFDGKAMDFNTFYNLASAYDEEQKRNNNFRPEDLKFLLDKNYGFWLVNAFGGTSDVISVTTSFTSANGRTSSTKTERFTTSVARYFEFDDNFISQGKAAYKAYLNELNNNRFRETNFPSSEVGFIPLSFDLVLDGISGIKIYNKLSINSEFLPSNYPDALKFVITKVNHNISNNNWETSLSTVSMPETKPYEYGKFPAPQGGSGGGNPGKIDLNNNFQASFTPQPGQEGKLNLLRDLIGKYESRNDYGIANTYGSAPCYGISTTNVLDLSLSELKRLSKLPATYVDSNGETKVGTYGTANCPANRIFAAGKYQVIPNTLISNMTSLGLTDSDIFSIEIQDKIADNIIFNSAAGPYIKGSKGGNEGTFAQLAAAVKALAKIWAALPTTDAGKFVKTASGRVVQQGEIVGVGNVITGIGNAAYYGGLGVNTASSKILIKHMVKHIIQTRINYGGGSPKDVPVYYILP